MFHLLQQRQYGLRGNQKYQIYTSTFIEHYKSFRETELVIEGREIGETIPIMSAKFSPDHTNILSAVDEQGGLMIIDAHKPAANSVVQEWLAHENAAFDVCWVKGSNKLLTAAGDRTVALWDVLNEAKLRTFKGHQSSVKTVTTNPFSDSLYASGSRDGHIILWDDRVANNNNINDSINAKGGYDSLGVRFIRNAHTSIVDTNKRRSKRFSSSSVAITSVLFLNENQILSSGSSDGEVRLWDMRKSFCKDNKDIMAKPVHVFPYPALKGRRKRGYSTMVLDSSHSRLFACCMDGVIYCFSCSNLKTKPIAAYAGHETNTHYIKIALSPEDLFLISGSSSKEAFIWEVDKPNKAPYVLKGHEEEVTCVQWCEDFRTIVTCSDDDTIRFWKLSSNKDSNNVTGHVEICNKPVDLACNSKVTKGLFSPVKRGQSGVSFTPSNSRRIREALTNLPSSAPSKFSDITKWLKRREESMPFKSPKKPNIINLIKSPIKNEAKPTASRALFRQPFEQLIDCASPSKKRPSTSNQAPTPKRQRIDSGSATPNKLKSPLRPKNTESPRTPEMLSARIAAMKIPSAVSPDVLGLLRSPTKDLPDFVKSPLHRTPSSLPKTPVSRNRHRRSTPCVSPMVFDDTTPKTRLQVKTAVERSNSVKVRSLRKSSTKKSSTASKSILNFFSPSTKNN
ncbi:DgyrCDS11529 [Dimorphilus gyrociliatus]|uniref:DgyrCDS11529 n=1 Tax=Dimorphilus gyrociliatus TaxID=2664684 RepID=A0A7I8W4J2_9ANNE|nr:DgyrCDS11529 [Dimorphilus gyrociliatus]